MDASYQTYYQKLAHKFAMLLIIVGALNWGLIATTRTNLVERIFGRGSMASRAVYFAVGLSALYLAFNRDTYLPFLGDSVMPCTILQDQVPSGATRSVQVRVQPGAKVIYWATEPSDNEKGPLPDWNAAYRGYNNAGVATADVSGVATLKVREPQAYKVPLKGRLEPHIHFRECRSDGFIDRIKTVFVNDGRVEGFQ